MHECQGQFTATESGVYPFHEAANWQCEGIKLQQQEAVRFAVSISHLTLKPVFPRVEASLQQGAEKH